MSRYLSKFLYILADKKRALFVLLFTILLTSLLEGLGIGLIGPFIGLASNPDIIEQNPALKQTYGYLGLTSKSQFIALLGILILIVFYVKSFFNFRNKRYIFKFSLQHQGELRLRLLKTYLSLPYTFHLKKNTALIVQAIVNETSTFCNGVMLEILNSTVNLVVLFVLISLLVVTDPVATLVISLTLLSTFFFILKFKRQLSLWGKEISQAQTEMIRIVNHSMGGLKETKVIGCESYFEEQLEQQAQRHANSASSFMSFGMMPRILIEVIIITFIIGLTAVSLLLGRGTENLISTLGVFAVVSIRLMPSVTQLTSGFGKLRGSSYVLDKLYHDLKEFEKLNLNIELKDNQRCLSFNRQITLEEICYRYDGVPEPALTNISLNLEKGRSIALIGKSGAGKTTLVDVVLGLLTPDSGDIRVDNQSIYEDLRAWQNLIGYIPQSIFLIDDTIERNIAFGVPDHLIDPEKLNKAIKAAQLVELIEQLPQGFKTNIGERGVCLSGGQRQRVGIARAIYHEREILVLDEATSALDNETENLVTEAIKSLSGTKTMIIIAHRLTTIEHCDRIYLMEKGRISKSGSYQEVVLGENLLPS